ncbi:MAG: nucleoside-triphosphatase [Promethearchaeota archaeon]
MNKNIIILILINKNPMNIKILITGLPRSGKSTLITQLIEHYSKKQMKIYGFLTPEVREGNHRIGFDVEEINTKKREKLARISSSNSKYHLGNYSVYIKNFEEIISKLEKVQFREGDLIIVDEIGKMELFSIKFRDFITKIFNSNIPIIASIGLKVKKSIRDHLLSFPDVNLFTLNRDNFQKTYQKIISMI